MKQIALCQRRLPRRLKAELRTMVHSTLGALALVSALAAHGQPMRLTTDIPACRTLPGSALPERYNRLAKAHQEFRWLSNASGPALAGAGWERIDGSNMRDWFAFYRIDLNNDGVCDWYLYTASPMSSGGDRDSINTLYLRSAQGWRRIGATIPDDKPDQLGFGQAYTQQRQYLFGEEVGVIYDAAGKTTYLVTAFYERNVQRDRLPGYRIFDWDAARNTLRLLDKSVPGSKAGQVYAYFKLHGARVPATSDAIQHFDAEVEAFEREQMTR